MLKVLFIYEYKRAEFIDLRIIQYLYIIIKIDVMFGNNKVKRTLILFVVLLAILSSCSNQPETYYLNRSEDYAKIQKHVDKLSKSIQIDTLSIRSSEGLSILSSIFIEGVKEEDESDLKTKIEFISRQNFTTEEQSKVKVEALHSNKINLEKLPPYIESAKEMLPVGCSYQDVRGIRYAASPFGEKYYIELEINIVDTSLVDNEYVEEYYSQKQTPKVAQSIDFDAKKMGEAMYTILFILENNNLKMVKVK